MMDKAEKLEAFWSDYQKKIWIVDLESGSRRRPETDRKIVRAETRQGALETAASVTWLSGRLFCREARLAHPVSDLGCTWQGEGEAPV